MQGVQSSIEISFRIAFLPPRLSRCPLFFQGLAELFAERRHLPF